MTQDSAYHNGFQIGDAKLNTAKAFHMIMSHVHLGDGGYIIPSGSTNTLGVTFSAGQTVSVAAGSAFVAGVSYTNSASLNVALDNNSTPYDRIDRIVIRVDWNTQTARIAAKRGVAANPPAIPSLQQDIGNVYEVSLATIYIPSNFTGFGSTNIFDDRIYLLTPEEDDAIKNIMFNSEFIPYTNPTHAGYCDNTPLPMWFSDTASVTFVDTANKFDAQSRGRTLEVDLTSTRNLYTYIYVNNGNTKRATLSFVVHVLSGNADLDFSMDGGATTLYSIPATAEPITVLARTTVGSSGGAQAIQPHFSSTGTLTFKLGQVTLAIGNSAAPFMPQKELIIHPYRFQLFSGDLGDSGSERKEYDTEEMIQDMKNAFCVVKYADSLSSGTDTSYYAVNNNVFSTNGVDLFRIERGRSPNSLYGYGHGMVGLDLYYGTPLYIWSQYITVSRNGVPSSSFDLAGVQV